MGQLYTESAELGLEILLDALTRTFAAQAAFLHAPKRGGGAGGVNIIDTNNTKLQLFKRS